MRKKVGAILILKGCRLGIAFLNLYLSARYFGVSIERDIWLLSMNIFLIFDMAIWGPINETFRTKFVFLKAELGEDNALAKTRSLVLFTIGITFLLTVCVLWMPNLVAAIIAPSYKGTQLTMLLLMIRLLAPSFLFNQVTQLFISILNSYNSIYIPEMAGVVSGLINLGLLVLLAPSLGIQSLIYAYYVSLLVLLVLVVVQMNAKKIRLFSHLNSIRLSDAKPFILFSLPFFLPYFIGQVALVVEKSISSSLGAGVVSSLDYSRRFSDVVVSILLGMLLTVIVPILSSHFAQRNSKAFVHELRQIYQLGFLLLTFVVCILTVCPYSLIQIIYHSGNITEAWMHKISKLTAYYSWSAIAIFLYYVFGIGLLSSKKEKYYALYGSLAQVMMIVLNLSFYKRLDASIFPLSLLLSHLIAAVIMWYHLPYGKTELLKVSVKHGGVLLAAVFVMYTFNQYFISSSSAIVVLFINIFVLLVILIGTLFCFRLDERLILINAFQKLFGNNSDRQAG